MNKETVAEIYDTFYFEPGDSAIVEATEDDLYFYRTFVGRHTIDVERGDCVYYLSDDEKTCYLKRGPVSIESSKFATIIRGYMPENKSSSILTKTNLPYVNGCSTKQIFPPDRLGDPTLQLLNIPPHSAEQAHHVHSTGLVVFVLSGTGRSLVGMEGGYYVEDLYPGKVVVLGKFAPHHFETNDQHLVVLPLHIFSSVAGLENNHPMFNGTHLT